MRGREEDSHQLSKVINSLSKEGSDPKVISSLELLLLAECVEGNTGEIKQGVLVEASVVPADLVKRGTHAIKARVNNGLSAWKGIQQLLRFLNGF